MTDLPWDGGDGWHQLGTPDRYMPVTKARHFIVGGRKLCDRWVPIQPVVKSSHRVTNPPPCGKCTKILAVLNGKERLLCPRK